MHALVRTLVAAFALAAAGLARAAENLDRGVVAVPTADGKVYVGWRLLASDPAEIAFDVYRTDAAGRNRTKLTARPITDSTNFVAAPGEAAARYVVEAHVRGRKLDESKPAQLDEAAAVGGYRRIKLDGSHRAQRVGVADFDGDGALDYLVKQPDFNVDPYQMPGYWKKSPEPIKLEAYRSDGTLMWRYDMGWAIETGIWYSPIICYDLDGDGRAEVYTKAGEGDPRDARGLVTTGPEWLVKIDGRTGKVVEKRDWPARDDFDDRNGKNAPYYNYYSRNLLGLAFLDGRRPHLVVERGTYSLIKIEAYDPALRRVWQFAAAGDHKHYRGQGTHGMQVADIDGDGRDELVIGAAAIDDNGQPLWTTGRGHPDVCYVADIDPRRPGLEVFYGHEWKQPNNGVCLVDARTGETIWGYEGPTTHIHGQGMVADIDPDSPGLECYGGERDGSKHWLYSSDGKLLGTERLGGLSPRAVFWADGPTKAFVRGKQLEMLRGGVFGQIEGNIVGIGDVLGDWREELITSVDGELRIYTTTVPATSRRPTLLQDRQYRTAVAMQTMGYLYPPLLGGKLLPDSSRDN